MKSSTITFMKKKLSLVPWRTRICKTCYLLVLFMLAIAATVNAEDANYKYITNGSAIAITDYIGSSADVTIPSTINSMPVTIIHDAFSFNGFVTSVTIPDSVTNLAGSTFMYCTNLSSVTIPASVTRIGDSVFNNCHSLTSVTIPANVTRIGDSAFADCYKLTSVTIPDSVTSIGYSAFGNCTDLTNATVFGSVTNFGQRAFAFCYKLNSISISTGVTSIGIEGFMSCTNLASVIIPDSVTIIGHKAFYGCRNLASVTIPDSLTNIEYETFAWCKRLEGVTIPGIVTNIEHGAFADSGLTNIIIPDNVSRIGYEAFAWCTNLKSATIPSGITNMEEDTFSYCTNLTSVYFKGNAPSTPGFGGQVFYSDDTATVYYLPSTTGWGEIYSGRPTALWKPQMSGDANFGVRSNQFGFNIAWASGMVVVVDVSTNLLNPDWSPVRTNTLAGDSSYYGDPQWTNHPTRVYRLRWP